MRSFSLLSRVFSEVRENLRQFHRREKDRYDLGAVEHLFKPGDIIRVRLKTRFRGPAKFAPTYSGPHTVESVRGVILTVREHSTNRVYNIHHDRASNPVWVPTTGPGLAPPVVETDANPVENEKETIENSQPARNAEEALIRTRSGRAVRQRRDSDYEYQFPLIEFSLFKPSAFTSYHVFNPCGHANPEFLALPQAEQARHALTKQLADENEVVCYLEDRGDYAFMMRATGTIFIFDEAVNDFVNGFAFQTYTGLKKQLVIQRSKHFRALNNAELTLPEEERDLPGFAQKRHMRPGYGFSEEWKLFVEQRSRKEFAIEASASAATRNLMALAGSTGTSTPGPSGLIPNPAVLALQLASSSISAPQPRSMEPSTRPKTPPRTRDQPAQVSTPFTLAAVASLERSFRSSGPGLGPGPVQMAAPSQPYFPTCQAQTQTHFTPPSVVIAMPSLKEAMTPASTVHQVEQSIVSATEQPGPETSFPGRDLISPSVAEDLFGGTDAAFEQLQLQHAQRLARALDPMLEQGSRAVVNSALFKLHLDLVGLTMSSETQQPDPQQIDLVQWLQISNPRSNRVAVMDTKATNRFVWRLFERMFPQLANYPRREIPHEEFLEAAAYIVRDPSGVLQPRTEPAAPPLQANPTFPLHLFLPAFQAAMQQSQAQLKVSAPPSPKPDPQAATNRLSQVSTVSATQAPESSQASTIVTPLQSELENVYVLQSEAAPTGLSQEKAKDGPEKSDAATETTDCSQVIE